MAGNGTGSMNEDVNTLRLLLSTDNHLGYCEKDPVRGEDSFRTFQEILQLAQSEKVDLLLLGGDLFHENKPSRKSMYQAMSLLRSHCMGDGAVRFQIVSDQSLNFPNFGVVNYEDPNFNIQLPIFSIHGNHDDPSREGGAIQQSLAALDLLSAANYINYFGKSDKVDAIEVFPILMVKGTTQVAIYGLGNMRDERLNRMFAQKKVVFRRPKENPKAWFSIFVVHQNRDDRGRGSKNCIPESFIPDFIDFVMWGHEHECVVDVEESVKGDFFITQPGSSVATSLVEGEAKQKHVAVLEIRGQSFRMNNHMLKTVRPFKMGEIVLSEVEDLDPNDPNVTDRIREVLEERVLELLHEAENEQQQQQQSVMYPALKQVLVRLRVEHTGFPVIHNQRFGSRFVGKIANPNDILLFFRKKKDRVYALDQKGAKRDSLMALNTPIRPTRLDTVTIEDILSKQLHISDQKLVFLPEEPLSIALENYIVKNIPSALDDFVDSVLAETQRELASKSDAKSKQDILSVVEKKNERINAEHLLQQEELAEAGNSGLSSLSQVDDFQTSLHPQSNKIDEEIPSANDVNKKLVSGDRFGLPRTAPTRQHTSPKRKIANASEDDSDDDSYLLNSSSAKSMSRKRKFTSPVRQQPARRAAVNSKTSGSKKAAIRRDFFSDDDDEEEEEEDGDDDHMMEDDGDEDYEQNEEEESEMTEPTHKQVRRGKSVANVRNRKRLRKQSEDDDDRELFSDDDKPARKRGAPKKTALRTRTTGTNIATAISRTKKPTNQDEVDLCSSESDSSKPVKRQKPTPQPKIDQVFKRQQRRSLMDEDDVESDPEFTQLTNAPSTATTAPGMASGRIHAPGISETQTEASQSQDFDGSIKRRKLPLSMITFSQSATQVKRDSDASAIRKGWGRSRR